MQANKLKGLLIAVCCITTLCTQVQGAEEEKELAAAVGRGAQGGALNAVSEEMVPAGSIVAFAGAVAPQGWLLCDGQECSSRDYPNLWKAIKTKYVPAQEEIRVLRFNADEDSGYKLFFVPDLRGRVIVGVDGGAGRVTANNKLGASGGEEAHQLTVAELASHQHVIGRHPNSGTPGGSNTCGGAITADAYHTESAGGDQPHNNMQPYQVLNYIISTGKPDILPEADGQKEKIEQLERKIRDLEVSQQGCAKAWVTFDGSANILNSYGVSSVTGHDGDYAIKFSKPFKSNNYCSALSARGAPAVEHMIAVTYCTAPQTAEVARIVTFNWNTNGACVRPLFVSAVFYGD